VVFRTSGYFFLGLLGFAVLAFWPQYVRVLPRGEISGYVHLHAVVMTLWFALLITQPFLLRAGRRGLHRALGKLSYVVAPAVVVATVLLTHAALRRDAADRGLAGAGNFVYLPLSMITLFAICYGLAIAYRKTPALHARFMICTSLAVIDPILSRVLIFYLPPLADFSFYPAFSFGLTATVLLALIVVERRQSRGRAVFPAMLAMFAAAYGLWFAFAPSSAWLAVARRFHDLPLT
jgi:hypothetical protein